jgi:hypothetical protein
MGGWEDGGDGGVRVMTGEEAGEQGERLLAITKILPSPQSLVPNPQSLPTKHPNK